MYLRVCLLGFRSNRLGPQAGTQSTSSPPAPSGTDRGARDVSSSINAGRVPMDREHGRIGFMSTQRREGHSTPATKIDRMGPWNRWQRTRCAGCAGVVRRLSLAPVARYGRADADDIGRTAPPDTPARRVTNSLLKDHHSGQLVWQDVRRGSPPHGGTFRSGANGPSATHRSFLSPISPPLPATRVSIQPCRRPQQA